jgi:hypothetical protein
MSAKVINGVLVADQGTASQIMSRLVSDIRANASKQAQFQSNPRGFIGAYGLSEDIQNEFLRDSNLDVAQSCTFTCVTTCWFTECAITNITVNK